MADRRLDLLGKFRDSSRTRLKRLLETWQRISEGGARDAPTIALLMREIHTLKGESKLMGFGLMNEVAHNVEDRLVALRGHDFQGGADAKEALLAGVDLLAALVELDADPPGDAARRAGHFLRGEEAASVASDEASSAALSSSAGEEQLFRIESRALVDLTDRVSSLLRRRELLDRIVNDMQRVATDLLREAARPAGAPPRREKVVALVKELATTIGRAQDEGFENRLEIVEIQESVRRMRMVRIAALFERHPAATRQLGRDLNKKVRVDVDDGDVSIDKHVADMLSDPLLHLLRNAVDHGIETPAERLAQRKPEVATVSLRARGVGGQVEIEISDDGRGIDPAHIKAAAIKKGLWTPDMAARASDAEALELMFSSGFSTRDVTTDVSGRGVGLDVVKQTVEGLGGVVRVNSVPGRGTSFVMRVPVSLALVRSLVFASDAGLFALPSTSVRLVARLEETEVLPGGEGRHVKLDGERLPLVDLHDVMGLAASTSSEGMIIVVDDRTTQVALRVGRILGELQLVKQPLDPFLAGSSVINGAAILDGGRHCFFLNTLALVGRAAPAVTAASSTSRGRRRVLIVDDSEITRDMLVSLLQRRGFETIEAVDGKDALDKVPAARPDLVLTDLDMPVMDGVGLIRALRADASTSGLPIVVLSTRGSAADKERAMNAGASGYLVKSNFREADLVESFSLLLGHSAPLASGGR